MTNIVATFSGRATRGRACRDRWPRFAFAAPAMLAALAVGSAAPALGAAPVAQQRDTASKQPTAAGQELAVSPAARLAEGLLATIPPDSRLALRPLDPRETGLPRAVGGRLYESILNAVLDASHRRGVTVLARERLHEVYGSLEEFYQGDIKSMLQAAQADVEIICKATPVAEGVRLACGATELEGTVNVAHAMAVFPLERPLASLDIAVPEMARRLAEGAPAVGPVERVMLMDTSIGARGDLGAYLGRRLEGELIQRMADRKGGEDEEARVAATLRTASEKSAEQWSYRLEGDIWRLDDERIRLEVRLRSGGRSLVAAGADIAVSSLPSHLVGSGESGGTPGERYEAVAEAVVSDRLDRASALRAARNLARARVIAQALALPPPGVTAITGEGDAMATFSGYLDKGLPVHERYEEVWPEGGASGEEWVAVRVAARVVPIGGVVRPAVSARLEHAVYEAMKPMRLEIRSEEAARLGVFSWGADDRVVRLYPRGRDRLEIGAGETIFLPRRGEGELMSVPLPTSGNREDHEAFVVVASTGRVDFAGLAPEVGATLSDTMKRAVDGAGFLAALAEQDPARMALVWLPYQVHE